MDSIPDRLEITGIPPYVESWAVAKVTGFVPAILRRWQRAHPNLPNRFYLVMCPVAEVNAQGGIPGRVHELTDPRLACRHFTGCSRPYYALILSGDDADARRAEIQSILPWSEGYSVVIEATCVHLQFVEASEDLDDSPQRAPLRRVAELLESGELLKILA